MTSSKSKNRICAVIPFFNEEKHLHLLIPEVKKHVDTVILVDDGSTDSSSSTIQLDENVILIKHSTNKGKGAALLTGFKKSIELNSEITITIDADFQHDPNLIPKFIESLENFDAIIGSRKINSSMPIPRRLSNYLTSKLLSIKTGYKILDSQSGFRGFKTNILPQILPTYAGFEAESEMIVKICKRKLSLSFIDIPTTYGNDDTKMKAIPAIIGFIKVLLKS